MKYFRFNGKDDLWLGKYGKSEITLIPNELLTQKEVDRIKRDCPRLSIDKAFTVVELSPNDTYSSFGVRFQNDTDHNTKFESRNRYCRTHINNRRMIEDYDGVATLTDEEIQKVLSVLLRSCSDKALATIVRKIIFSATYDIDWQEAWDIITEYMPELTQYNDFNSIISAIR